jgi:hypothetical protein
MLKSTELASAAFGVQLQYLEVGEQVPLLMAELVRLNVEVIVTLGQQEFGLRKRQPALSLL